MKKEDIDRVLAELKALQCKTQKEVEEARVRFLGRKGEITALFEEFRTVDKEMKREFGRTLNELKNTAQETIDSLRDTVGEGGGATGPKQDLSMPGDPIGLGSRHPVSIVRQEIVDIFRKFGYDVAEGPEVEDDYHVFEALNFPPNHPRATCRTPSSCPRGIPNPLLLRTHTPACRCARWSG
jgi:Phenylalanyl-tRNA synthetase alpha subunit